MKPEYLDNIKNIPDETTRWFARGIYELAIQHESLKTTGDIANDSGAGTAVSEMFNYKKGSKRGIVGKKNMARMAKSFGLKTDQVITIGREAYEKSSSRLTPTTLHRKAIATITADLALLAELDPRALAAVALAVKKAIYWAKAHRPNTTRSGAPPGGIERRTGTDRRRPEGG